MIIIFFNGTMYFYSDEYVAHFTMSFTAIRIFIKRFRNGFLPSIFENDLGLI